MAPAGHREINYSLQSKVAVHHALYEVKLEASPGYARIFIDPTSSVKEVEDSF